MAQHGQAIQKSPRQSIWTPVIEALKHPEPGGRLVINAIHKSHFSKAAQFERKTLHTSQEQENGFSI